MEPVEIIGLIAGLLTNFAVIPQIIKIYRSKSARDISFLYNTMMFTGVLMWLAYGIISRRPSLIFWNILGTLLNSWLLLAKIKYSR
jgi:MtN3 and saliva related transmembrane protein